MMKVYNGKKSDFIGEVRKGILFLMVFIFIYLFILLFDHATQLVGS